MSSFLKVWVFGSLCMVVTMCMTPHTAVAQEEPPSRVSVRVSALSSGTVWLNDPGLTFSLLGVELNKIFENQLVLEATGQLYFGFDSPGYGASARLGYAFRELSGRFLFESYWIPFIGYAYNVHALDGEEHAVFNHTQNIQLGLAGDHLLGGQTEYVLRFIGALEYAVHSTQSGPERRRDDELFRFGVHLGMLLGVTWD